MMNLRVSAVAALGAHTAFGVERAERQLEIALRDAKEVLRSIAEEDGLPYSTNVYSHPKPKTSDPKTKTVCTCPDCMPKPAPKPTAPAHKPSALHAAALPDDLAKRTAIFFDFDDTLVPTKFLMQNDIKTTESMMSKAQLESLRDVAEVAAKVLAEAKSLGHVCMVTAGKKSWIESVLAQSWAKKLDEALKDVEKKTTRGKDWTGPDANAGFSWDANGYPVFKVPKKEQMENFLKERSLEMMNTNLISVGDSNDEIDAIKLIGSERNVDASSIKLEYGKPDGPEGKIRTVAKQLERILDDLRQLRDGKGSRHLVY